MSNSGGGGLSINSSDAKAEGTPNVSATLGSDGSIVIASGGISGTALSDTGSRSSTSSGTGGLALNVNDFTADASMDPTVAFTVGGGSTTTSQFGTVDLNATHNESSASDTYASASGGGGGFINVGTGTSTGREHLTISNTVYGVVNGLDVNITTNGNVAVEGHTDNGGGGFVSVTNADSNASASVDNSVWIAGGAQVNASRNADVNAHSDLRPYATASSNGGGFVSGASGSVEADADYNNVATVQGSVVAGDTATVEAHVFVSGTAVASGNAGGAFTGGGTTADVEVGRNNALNQVHLLDGGQVKADVAVLDAEVDGISTDSEAYATASAGGASTSAEGDINIYGATEVRLESGSYVFGNVQIAITSVYDGTSMNVVGDATCHCGLGDTHGRANMNDNTDALVSGIAGSVLSTWDLEVNADQFGIGYGFDVEQNADFIDIGGISLNGQSNYGRDIYWESTVYLAPSPNPEVTVNSNGTVTKLVNASLTDQFGNPYFVGSTFAAGRIIEVGDLVDSGSGIANFAANDLTGLASFLASVERRRRALRRTADRPHLGQRRRVRRRGRVGLDHDHELVQPHARHPLHPGREHGEPDRHDHRHGGGHPGPDEQPTQRRLAGRVPAESGDDRVRHPASLPGDRDPDPEPPAGRDPVVERDPRRDDHQPDRAHSRPQRPREHPLRARRDQGERLRGDEQGVLRRAERLDRQRRRLHRHRPRGGLPAAVADRPSPRPEPVRRRERHA